MDVQSQNDFEPIDRKTSRSICDAVGERLQEDLRPIRSRMPSHLELLMEELRLQDDDRVTVDMSAPIFDLARVPFDPAGLQARELGAVRRDEWRGGIDRGRHVAHPRLRQLQVGKLRAEHPARPRVRRRRHAAQRRRAPGARGTRSAAPQIGRAHV